jgi:trimethylamine--corrinoid protein Co-methyltransferase
MRRGHALLASPESALLTLASLQLARFSGLPSHSCFPCSESHAHDQQQAWEKSWTTLPAMMAGVDMLVNLGLFAGGLTASLPQLVLDAEMMAGLRRLRLGFTVTDESVALDTIRSVGPGGSFLGQPHTVRYLRTGEHWIASLLNRSVHDTWDREGARDVVVIARAKARDLLGSHVPPPVDPAVEAEVGRFVAAYDRSVGVEEG